MVAVNSTMLPLGTEAPGFELPDAVGGGTVSLADFAGAPILVMFLSNHCPFVKHIRDALAAIGRDFGSRGFGIVGINSNDIEAYPDDSPAMMKVEAAEAGYPFPYLFDESQEVAKAYRAACTPDFFVFDRAHKLVYRGQLDDSRPSNGKPVTGRDLRAAMEAVLAGEAVAGEQMPSIGCNIKWKAGNAPEYFG
ncbi:Alkyl hydroperoxide reductase and/or thiol-specific antioxidant family (AhpC/TSA) protein [hydrothermal vent metagenome]|uniref:Alkyl hydroperoxide reductase and/or thiol-specific antioxidant family (AhpC/TSA) protein n=1 Tax=hydrothermal vent metagenome TaxID=652676 RepID=A0A3B1D7E8_9ZZZZ